MSTNTILEFYTISHHIGALLGLSNASDFKTLPKETQAYVCDLLVSLSLARAELTEALVQRHRGPRGKLRARIALDTARSLTIDAEALLI